MADPNSIAVTYQGRIAIVTLNQPDKLNALSIDLYQLLADRLREVEQRDDVYITVLTGTGRFFSA
jgi:Delta3-Delta2-enoyl-CoA isomerase